MGWKGETCIRFRKVPITCCSEAALCASSTYSVRSRHGVLVTSAITLSRLLSSPWRKRNETGLNPTPR